MAVLRSWRTEVREELIRVVRNGSCLVMFWEGGGNRVKGTGGGPRH